MRFFKGALHSKLLQRFLPTREAPHTHGVVGVGNQTFLKRLTVNSWVIKRYLEKNSDYSRVPRGTLFLRRTITRRFASAPTEYS